MHHHTKRNLSIVLILTIMLLFLAACNNSTTQTPPGSQTTDNTSDSTKTDAPQNTVTSTGKYNEPGTYPISNELVEINVMLPANTTIADYNTLFSTTYFEEKSNVHVNWDVVADVSAIKSVLLASGDVPDIFVSCGITSEEQMIYGGRGLFVDLAPYIDSVGHFIHDMFEYDSSVRPGITAPDGGIYSLPTYSKAAHMTNANKMWVNQVWLDKLGMEHPTTTDEFYDMLVAFKTKDPNGDGQANEIPLSGVGANAYHSVIPYVMSAFILDDGYATGRFVQPLGDQVDVIFDKDEYRDGLRFLAKLYSEGLLDAETFTQDIPLRKQKVSNASGMLVGAAPSNAPSNFADIDTESFAAYEPLLPIEGPGGVRGAARFTGEAFYITGRYTITSKCADPELAFRWADMFYDIENNLPNCIGEEGKQWRYAEDGELGINGEPAMWATLSFASSDAGNVAFNQSVHSFRTAEWRLGEVAASEDKYYLRAGMENRIYDASVLYDPYTTAQDGIFYPFALYIDLDYADEYADLRTDIYKYVDESAVAFITGSMNIETDWDSYVANLQGSLELPRYLELVQDALSK